MTHYGGEEVYVNTRLDAYANGRLYKHTHTHSLVAFALMPTHGHGLHDNATHAEKKQN